MNMSVLQKQYDVAILGSGPGGYPAAIRLAQAGKKVALIEAKEIGGTCLNRGCIPTKTLLANASVFHTMQQAKQYGIFAKEISVDWSLMLDRKVGVVAKLRNSLEGLIGSNGIEIIRGFGSFLSDTQLKVVSTHGQESRIQANDIIIATGSEPKVIKQFPFDGQAIHSSTTILDLKRLPESIAIIGGGVIGCEFASLFADFGVQVTIIEALDRVVPLECETVSSYLSKSFQKRGITILCKTMVQSITRKENSSSGVIVDIANAKSIEADISLVAVGRSLNSDAIGLDNTKVQVEKGAIQVNDRLQTSVPHIWAIGDVTAKSLYAHVATHQGIIAAENILKNTSVCMHYNAIPGVIFTRPEIATVGLSLDAAKKAGWNAVLASYPMQGLGKAQAELHTDGFAQVVIEESTGRILGAQIVGYEAGNLIAHMTLAISNELTIESVSDTIHAHPTLAESWLEASFIAQNIPLHFPKNMLNTVRKSTRAV